MQKILIIGAKGMLGQELVNVFGKDKNLEVFAWDKEDLDITDEKKVNLKISKLKPNVIINSAAYNAVDKCEDDEKEFELAKKINGEAPGYLAKATKKIDAILVHYSTDHVFDGKQNGFDENAAPNPINNYGKSKLLGEKEVAKNSQKYYIIRLAALFGKPAISDGAKRGFFEGILEAGKKGEIKKIVNEETTCFTYAPDLAKKTKEIIESKKSFGIYHITNSGFCTWHEAAVELFKQAKIKTKLIPVPRSGLPRPAEIPVFSALISTKLDPLRDWKEALGEYLSEIRHNSNDKK